MRKERSKKDGNRLRYDNANRYDNSAESICFRRGGRFCFTGKTLTSSSAYTYYPTGNVATDTENTGKVTTYLYDDLGRLTSEAITGTNNNSTLTYTYDDRGNRLTQSRGNATVTYTYDLNNRLTSHTASGVVTIYNYDENGNTISTYVGGNFAGGYTYDLFNRQKTYTPDGTVYTTTTYRPDGMRHSIGNTKHIWDNGNIVGDISGSTYKQYFRALNLIYSLIGTTTQYYRYNGHGDVVALTNSSGTVTKTYTYNAFGEEQNIDATDANPFRYCGEYFDKVSGTLYLRARNYNASIGRFTQEDPIRADGNFYAYCGNNPVNAHDPSGLKFLPRDYYVDVDGNKAPAPANNTIKRNTDTKTTTVQTDGTFVTNSNSNISDNETITQKTNEIDNFVSVSNDIIEIIIALKTIQELYDRLIVFLRFPFLRICSMFFNFVKMYDNASIFVRKEGNNKNSWLFEYENNSKNEKSAYVDYGVISDFDILVYAIEKTKEVEFSSGISKFINVWRFYNEYKFHMDAWFVLAPFYTGKPNSNGLAGYAEMARKADVDVEKMDGRFPVDMGTILEGVIR